MTPQEELASAIPDNRSREVFLARLKSAFYEPGASDPDIIVRKLGSEAGRLDMAMKAGRQSVIRYIEVCFGK